MRRSCFGRVGYLAAVSDLGQTKLIDGTWYTATATAIKTGPDEYETQIRWYLAKWKDVARAKRGQQ